MGVVNASKRELNNLLKRERKEANRTKKLAQAALKSVKKSAHNLTKFKAPTIVIPKSDKTEAEKAVRDAGKITKKALNKAEKTLKKVLKGGRRRRITRRSNNNRRSMKNNRRFR